jgi:hypothetical protein
VSLWEPGATLDTIADLLRQVLKELQALRESIERQARP